MGEDVKQRFLELVRRVQGGDLSAFETLHNEFTPIVRQYSRYYASSEDIDDIVQAVWLDLFKYLERGNAVRTVGLLFSIAKRRCADYANQRRCVTTIDTDQYSEEPQCIVPSNQFCYVFLGEIELLLPSDLALALWLSLMGLTCEEIAQNLDIPESTVRGRIARARKYLRRHFGEFGVGD